MLGATGSSEPKGDDDLHLVENLRYLRKMKGKLQQEIAIQLGVDQKTISSWERGTRTPTIEAIDGHVLAWDKVDYDGEFELLIPKNTIDMR